MNRNNDKTQGRWVRLKQFWDFGIILIVASGVLGFSKDRILSAFTMEALSQFPVVQLPIVLLVQTIFLVLLWMKVTSSEIQMLKDYFTEYIPALPRQSFHIIVVLGFTLGVLGCFYDRIAVYCSVFVTFKLFEIWGTWIRDSKFKAGFEEAKKSAAGNRLNEVNIIEGYYLNKPQLQLAVTVLFFTFVSLILGLLGKTLPERDVSKWFTVGAYSVMIATIAVNEFVYMIWRHNRDKALGEYYS